MLIAAATTFLGAIIWKTAGTAVPTPADDGSLTSIPHSTARKTFGQDLDTSNLSSRPKPSAPPKPPGFIDVQVDTDHPERERPRLVAAIANCKEGKYQDCDLAGAICTRFHDGLTFRPNMYIPEAWNRAAPDSVIRTQVRFSSCRAYFDQIACIAGSTERCLRSGTHRSLETGCYRRDLDCCNALEPEGAWARSLLACKERGIAASQCPLPANGNVGSKGSKPSATETTRSQGPSADPRSWTKEAQTTSCNNGDADSCLALAEYFENGSPLEYEKARVLTQQACDLELLACLALARLYGQGIGGPIDETRAVAFIDQFRNGFVRSKTAPHECLFPRSVHCLPKGYPFYYPYRFQEAGYAPSEYQRRCTNGSAQACFALTGAPFHNVTLGMEMRTWALNRLYPTCSHAPCMESVSNCSKREPRACLYLLASGMDTRNVSPLNILDKLCARGTSEACFL